MASKGGWSRRFDPIALPGGRQLVTLENAGNYITKLPSGCSTPIARIIIGDAASWRAIDDEGMAAIASIGFPLNGFHVSAGR